MPDHLQTKSVLRLFEHSTSTIAVANPKFIWRVFRRASMLAREMHFMQAQENKSKTRQFQSSFFCSCGLWNICDPPLPSLFDKNEWLGKLAVALNNKCAADPKNWVQMLLTANVKQTSLKGQKMPSHKITIFSPRFNEQTEIWKIHHQTHLCEHCCTDCIMDCVFAFAFVKMDNTEFFCIFEASTFPKCDEFVLWNVAKHSMTLPRSRGVGVLPAGSTEMDFQWMPKFVQDFCLHLLCLDFWAAHCLHPNQVPTSARKSWQTVEVNSGSEMAQAHEWNFMILELWSLEWA